MSFLLIYQGLDAIEQLGAVTILKNKEVLLESGKSTLGRVEMEENEHDFIHTLVAEVVTTSWK